MNNKIDGLLTVCKLPYMDIEFKRQFHDLFVTRRAEQFSFLSELVRAPSENPPGGCAEISALVASRLETLGFNVERHPEPSGDDPKEGLSNLVIRHEFGPGPTIALVAHGDTAVAGPDWAHDPFGGEIIDGSMFGRGVASGKGDIAAYVYALLALRELGDGLGGSVELHITFDGETGGDLGARWLLSNKIVAPDLTIASGATYNLVTTANGYLQLEVEIRGRGAPASMPDDGIDAVEAAARVMSAIYEHRETYSKITSKVPGIGSPTLVVSEVQGGESPRSVAGRVVLRIDRRLIPEEDPAKVENTLTTLIGTSVTKVAGVLCKVRRRGLSKAMTPGGDTKVLVDTFQRHAADILGAELELRGTPLDTDGRHYANVGIPTVLFGTGPADVSSANIGGPDEVLSLDDLRLSTELLSFVLADLLSEKTDET